MSLILGGLTPTQAMRFVRFHKVCGARDGVRHTTVARLREVGFVVTHTPNPGNPGHATVSLPSEWGEDACEMFDCCFDQPMFGWEVVSDE